MRDEALHDVVVIGAGAAGVSAAIECFDIQLDVVVLEAASKVGGQIDQIPHTVRNVATGAGRQRRTRRRTGAPCFNRSVIA